MSFFFFSCPVSCLQRLSLRKFSLVWLQPCRPVKKCCNNGKAAMMSAAPGECGMCICALLPFMYWRMCDTSGLGSLLKPFYTATDDEAGKGNLLLTLYWLPILCVCVRRYICVCMWIVALMHFWYIDLDNFFLWQASICDLSGLIYWTIRCVASQMWNYCEVKSSIIHHNTQHKSYSEYMIKSSHYIFKRVSQTDDLHIEPFTFMSCLP